MVLCVLMCLFLGLAAVAFFSVTSDDGSSTDEQASIIVCMEKLTVSGTDAVQTSTVTTPAATTVNTETQSSSAEQCMTSTAELVQFPININTAGADELMQLPGIGEVIAGNIVEYRDACGGFTSLRQLLEVEGIGEGRYEIIVNLIYIDVDVDYIIVETSPPETCTVTETTTTEWIPVVLDVNEADVDGFDALPGVDRELAENIVELRRKIGGFANQLELLYADGMTREIYISIMDYLECNSQEGISEDGRNY